MNEYVDFQNALALAIASGIGGDGEMMVQETLWEGVSGNYSEYVLNKSLWNYDLLFFGGRAAVGLDDITDHGFLLINAIKKQMETSSNLVSWYGGYDTRHLVFRVNDTGNIINNIGYYNQYITKIIGIKFTGTKSIDYSTEEQVIGKWIDGKPLYQKTVNISNPINDGSYIFQDNIDQIIEYSGYAKQKNGAKRPFPYYRYAQEFLFISGYNDKAVGTAIGSAFSGNYAIETIMLTCKYTKTTD